jgi:hypothetical protein
MLRTKIYNSKHEIAAVLDIVRHIDYHHFKNENHTYFEANDTIYNKTNLALYEKKDDAFVEVEYITNQLSDTDKQKVSHNVQTMCDFFDDKLTNDEFENSLQHIERKELELQKCELELIELVRSIDISVYVNSFTNADENFCNTDYEKMYDEDTTEVYFKAFIIAVAQLIQEKLNISYDNALLACTKIDIYNRYMQAETVEDIVEYAIKYKLV